MREREERGRARQTRGTGMGRWLERERAPGKREMRQTAAFSSSIVGGKLEWGTDSFCEGREINGRMPRNEQQVRNQ